MYCIDHPKPGIKDCSGSSMLHAQIQEYATALRLYKIAQEKLGKNSKQNLVGN